MAETTRCKELKHHQGRSGTTVHGWGAAGLGPILLGIGILIALITPFNWWGVSPKREASGS